MPTGPVGSCWQSGSWSDTCWQADSWEDFVSSLSPFVLERDFQILTEVGTAVDIRTTVEAEFQILRQLSGTMER